MDKLSEATKKLYEYEKANEDLTPATRRLLALGWLGSIYGKKLMETVVGQSLPRTPFFDSAWRWWTCLRLSGLDDKWEGFSSLAQTEGLRKAMQWLRRHSSDDQWELFRRRAGQDPHNTGGRKPKGRYIWTKGGMWPANSPITKLLVNKEHLPPRHMRRRWQHRLGDAGVRQLEKELMALINPNVMFPYEAKWTAVRYICRRIPELVGTRRKGDASIHFAAWFLTEDLPTPNGRGYIHVRPDGRTHEFADRTGYRTRLWDW